MKSLIVSEIASLLVRAPLFASAKIFVEKREEGGDMNSHARYYATIEGLTTRFKDDEGGKFSLREQAIETAKENAGGRMEGKLESWCEET